MARCLLLAALGLGDAMRLSRPWTEKPWCDSVAEPEWPMAYQKYKTQSVEAKGRVNSNKQDMRHKCDTYGGETKCHICENIEDGSINYQLQGVSWEAMAQNIPTVTDSPFAVGAHSEHSLRAGLTLSRCPGWGFTPLRFWQSCD